MKYRVWYLKNKPDMVAGRFFRVGPHVGECVFHLFRWYVMATPADWEYRE